MAGQLTRINKFLGGIEWRWSLTGFVVTAVTSSTITAWATWAAGLFEAYAPLSWVVAGFAALGFVTLVYLLWAVARTLSVRAKYNRRLYEKSGYIDPLAKTYEDKRIFLNDFCLPSHQLVERKTFINCEIIGPANIVLEYGNQVSEHRYPNCDAVLLKAGQRFFNAVLFRDCIFRQCSFQRITLLFPVNEYGQAKSANWLNWITENKHIDAPEPELSDGEEPRPLPLPSPQDTATETPQ